MNHSQILGFLKRDTGMLLESRHWVFSHLEKGGDRQFGTVRQVAEKAAGIFFETDSRWFTHLTDQIIGKLLKTGFWCSHEHGYRKQMVQLYYGPNVLTKANKHLTFTPRVPPTQAIFAYLETTQQK